MSTANIDLCLGGRALARKPGAALAPEHAQGRGIHQADGEVMP